MYTIKSIKASGGQIYSIKIALKIKQSNQLTISRKSIWMYELNLFFLKKRIAEMNDWKVYSNRFKSEVKDVKEISPSVLALFDDFDLLGREVVDQCFIEANQGDCWMSSPSLYHHELSFEKVSVWYNYLKSRNEMSEIEGFSKVDNTYKDLKKKYDQKMKSEGKRIESETQG